MRILNIKPYKCVEYSNRDIENMVYSLTSKRETVRKIIVSADVCVGKE